MKRNISELLEKIKVGSALVTTAAILGTCSYIYAVPSDRIDFMTEIQPSPVRPTEWSLVSYQFMDWDFDGEYDSLHVMGNYREDPRYLKNTKDLTPKEIMEIYQAVKSRAERENG